MAGLEASINNPYPEGLEEHTIVEGLYNQLNKRVMEIGQEIYDASGILVDLHFQYEFNHEDVFRLAEYLRANPIDKYVLFEESKRYKDG